MRRSLDDDHLLSLPQFLIRASCHPSGTTTTQCRSRRNTWNRETRASRLARRINRPVLHGSRRPFDTFVKTIRPPSGLQRGQLPFSTISGSRRRARARSGCSSATSRDPVLRTRCARRPARSPPGEVSARVLRNPPRGASAHASEVEVPTARLVARPEHHPLTVGRQAREGHVRRRQWQVVERDVRADMGWTRLRDPGSAHGERDHGNPDEERHARTRGPELSSNNGSTARGRCARTMNSGTRRSGAPLG